jgi:hypothetical protein
MDSKTLDFDDALVNEMMLIGASFHGYNINEYVCW